MKIFRDIRKKLAAQNKVTSYLRYAIGEIVLVVIGILIALQINSWNNTNMNHRKERGYLNNIIEDIKTQQLLVKNQLNHEIRVRLQCEKAINHLNSNHINADSLNIYLTNITRRTFVINDPTFQDLKSSGNLLLISNNDLRKKIISFYQYLDYSARVIEVSNESSIHTFREFLLQNSVINMNYKDSISVAGDVDWSLTSTDLPWAKAIQEKRLENKEYLFMLLNRVSQRGRTSSVHIDLMKRLEQRIESMQKDITRYLRS